ncbi:MAG TPA: PKD domain-containing protein [Verrucomicrobiae bacterium]
MGCLLFLGSVAGAATRYVNVNNLTPALPYASWAAAATSIQDAVDAAQLGDEIVVTNGVYQTGAQAVYGMRNRVAVTKPVTLRSVNGPAVTQIVGSGQSSLVPIRCVYLANGASLTGFTLTNGLTDYLGDDHTNKAGGGVWCEGVSAVVSNCVLSGNFCWGYGGGAYSGTLNDCTFSGNFAGSGGGASSSMLDNCTLTNNSAVWGGGAYSGTLNNCLLTSNSAIRADFASGGGAYQATLNNCALTGNSASSQGGGAFSSTLNDCTVTGNSAPYGGGTGSGTLNNCIVYYNSAQNRGANYDAGTLNYCCTTPLPAGPGNLVEEPLLANAWRLSADSPCRGRGSAAYASGVDIDGEPWANPPSIGCDEYWSGSLTGAVSVAIVANYTSLSAGHAVDFKGLIEGRVSASRWDFGDGSTVSNRPWASHTWVTAGDYVVELRAYNESYQAGVAVTVTVHVLPPVHYVAMTGSSQPPYSSWATAAQNIQSAVDVAWTGDEIVVSNGVYRTGARAVYGMSNRVVVTKPVIVRSVNGPAVTQIVGYQVPGTTNGPEAVRCVYLTNGAVLVGFTLTNGATQILPQDDRNGDGGGVYCEGESEVVSNCVLTGNSATGYGGGACRGTLRRCTLTRNLALASGGGCFAGTLNDCTLADNSAFFGPGGAVNATLNNCTLTGNSGRDSGGAWGCILNNCVLTGNSAYNGYGGAASVSTLNNCVLTGNSAYGGGGASWCTLNNCTLTGNSAFASGGGTYRGTLNDCIVYYNNAQVNGANYDGDIFHYCCTTPAPTGTGNLIEEPQLATIWRLSIGSPCRGRGNADYVSGVDIDGEPWANPPSIGCDEYWSGSVTGAVSAEIVAAITNVAVGFGLDFQAVIGGRVSASRWDSGDGNVVSNRPWATHAWTAAGDYVVELRAYNESYPAGVAATVTVHVVLEEHYVALNSTNPVPPYTSWATAANNIQDAVDAATQLGALVWVADGVYQTGERAAYGMNNRVVVPRPLTVRSVNGPAVTRIVGSGPNGLAAVRCVYLSSGAMLAGFTLTNGATQASGDYRTQCGGGVFCQGLTPVVSNCMLTGNSAFWDGGAAYFGTLNNCVLARNSASRVGGGASGSTLNNCILTSNSALDGGGANSGILNNCVLTANSADYYGGGARGRVLGGTGGTLNNCTLAGNFAAYGGGASGCELNNCIAYYNTAQTSGPNYEGGVLNYCDTTPLPTNGVGNIALDPLFVNAYGWADLRLQSSSPCINRGYNAYVTTTTDLDGNPRISGPVVDIGAYEFQWQPTILLADGNFGVRSNAFGFSVSAASGSVVVIEGSTNLRSWVRVQTNTAAAAPFYFVDLGWTNLPTRFYRARLQ